MEVFAKQPLENLDFPQKPAKRQLDPYFPDPTDITIIIINQCLNNSQIQGTPGRNKGRKPGTCRKNTS